MDVFVRSPRIIEDLFVLNASNTYQSIQEAKRFEFNDRSHLATLCDRRGDVDTPNGSAPKLELNLEVEVEVDVASKLAEEI